MRELRPFSHAYTIRTKPTEVTLQLGINNHELIAGHLTAFSSLCSNCHAYTVNSPTRGKHHRSVH